MRSVFKKMSFAMLPILIVITSMNVYFAGYQNYMQIIGEISEITALNWCGMHIAKPQALI